MRCLFLPDELEAFRPVAAAIRDENVEFVMLRELNAARLVLDLLDFDALLIGANRIDSPTLRFLQQWKPLGMPALGVTCVPWMRAELTAAGAYSVVLLPDETPDLKTAIRELVPQPRR
jgi:hypothetical protein